MELEREHPTSSEELSEKKDISSNSGTENEGSSGSSKLTGSKLGILTTGYVSPFKLRILGGGSFKFVMAGFLSASSSQLSTSL